MGMADECPPLASQRHGGETQQGKPADGAFSPEKMLELEREALRATIKARYQREREKDSTSALAAASSSTRLECDDEGRFAVASASLKQQAASPKSHKASGSRTRQRRIKSAAPRMPSGTASSQLGRRIGAFATTAGHHGSHQSLSSGSSALLSSESSTSVIAEQGAARFGDSKGPMFRRSTAAAAAAQSQREGLSSSSVQCTRATSRHLMERPERPHSSYTRPSSAVHQARQSQLRRRSVSEPSQLHIDVNDIHPIVQGTRRGGNPSQDATPSSSNHYMRPSAATPRKRPQSAMPRLQQTPPQQQRPTPGSYSQVFRLSGMENDSAGTELSVQGRKLSVPSARAWPGLLEEIDEEDWLQREQEEEELAFLMQTDPAAAQQQELRKALHIKKLETGSRPPSANDWRKGRIAIPQYHCDRCKDFWERTGNVPEECVRNMRNIPGFNWSRPRSGKGGARRSDTLQVGDEMMVPVNSAISIGADGNGDEDDDGEGRSLHRALSTIAGSEVGDMLKSGASSRSNVHSTDDGADAKGVGKHWSGALDGDEGSSLSADDPRTFIGADGKVYTPGDDLEQYKPQHIPPASPKKSGRKTSAKRRKSKRAKSALGRSSGSAVSMTEEDNGAGGDDADSDGHTGLDGIDDSDGDDGSATAAGNPQTIRMINGLRIPIDTSGTAKASGAAMGIKRSSKKKPKEPLKLENIQDRFTRAFTFTYYVPSKSHRDEVTSWKAKSKGAK